MRRLLPIALVAVLAGCGSSHPQGVARPVDPHLPWHTAVVGGDRNRAGLRPWIEPEGSGYARVLRLGWTFLEHRVPLDAHTHRPVYLNYATFNATTLQGGYWQNNPASVYAGLVAGLVQWHAYAADDRAVEIVRTMLDYQLQHGTTPRGWAWPGVPYASGCAGATAYGGCTAGLPRAFTGGIEPDKVGVLGLGYLRFYELTGDRRFLRAGVRSADRAGPQDPGHRSVANPVGVQGRRSHRPDARRGGVRRRRGRPALAARRGPSPAGRPDRHAAGGSRSRAPLDAGASAESLEQ